MNPPATTSISRKGENDDPLGPIFAGRSVLYIKEVVRHLRITRQHVSRLIEEGSLRAVNVNGRGGGRNCWRIPVAALNDFLQKRGDGV